MSGHHRLDAVVVGAGHNGLVAAAYLAQAGRSVRVIERDAVPGGAVSTVERFPGYRVDRGSSAHLMIRHTPVIDDLDLTSYGLRYLDCDPWAFCPATDSAPPIIFRTDLDATCASIEAACGNRDAAAYRDFVTEWTPRARAVMRAFTGEPSPLRFAQAFGGLGTTGTTARSGIIGRRAGAFGSVTQELMAPGDVLLDRWFDDERLKAALAWFGAQSGPPMDAPGTAPMVGFAALMHQIPPGRAVGGSGALTEALLRRLEADGARVDTAAPATEIGRCGDHWRVRTAEDSVCADTVVAACHISTTLDLLAAGGYRADRIDTWRRQIVVGNGIGMAVRMGTRALPAYTDLPSSLPEHGVHSALGLLVDDRAQLRTTHAEAMTGRIPQRPACVAMSFSGIDPSLAPPDRHQVSVWSQWHPYRPADGDWAELGESAAASIIAQVDRYAPGFADSVEHTFIQTPQQLADELGLIGGNIMHVEMTIDQMFFWRPHPDLTGASVPDAPGLLLAGASAHPGGGVTGASGLIAARLALRRRRRR